MTKERTTCRACHGTDLVQFFDMGLMPLAGLIEIRIRQQHEAGYHFVHYGKSGVWEKDK